MYSNRRKSSGKFRNNAITLNNLDKNQSLHFQYLLHGLEIDQKNE